MKLSSSAETTGKTVESTGNESWMHMTEMERLWSLKETAEFLGIPTGSLYQMNWRGTGPRSFRVGRYRQYAPADVRAWLDRHASQPQAEK